MTKRKKPEDKLKAGRPTLYKSEFCDLVIKLGRLGKSKAQIAADPRIDVSRNTLDSWCNENPEFLSALTRARDLALAAWEDKADEGIEGQGFNTGLWGRIMSARFPEDYREVKTSEVTGKNGKDLMPRANLLNINGNMTLEQLEALGRGLGAVDDNDYDLDL